MKDTDYRTMQEIVAYIYAHLDDDLSIKTLAARFGVNYSTLRHRFQTVTGMTLGHYVMKMRMECAAEDLLFGESVTDVCVGCNFESRASFNKAFKRVHGLCPRDYKAAHCAGTE